MIEAPTRTLTILHVAYSNAAGVPGRWAEAHRGAGHKAELILEVADEYQYGPEAIVQRWSDEPGDDVIWRIEQADAVMVYDSPFYLNLALQMEKPTLYRALGSHARRTVAETRELLRHPLVKRASAGTADLALALDGEFAGAPFPKLKRALPMRDVAVHSPSDRETKGTAAIEEMAAEAGWALEIVDDVSHETVLRAKRTCELVIDQFGDPPTPDGFGVAAIEAMAMGLPVIGRATQEVKRAYREVGCPGILVNTREGFVFALEWLRDDSVRRSLGNAGQKWVRTFHDAETRAREDLEALAA